MEATTRTNERQDDPRRSAARKYWMLILARVERAVYAYSLRIYFGGSEAEIVARFGERIHACNVPIREAIRLANNGLGRLASYCGRLPTGWVEEVIEKIASVGCQMTDSLRNRHYDPQLLEVVTDYFADAFAILERCLPPEDDMPWVTFDPQKGLLMDESVNLHRLRLRGDTKILIDLLLVNPAGLTNARMMVLTDIGDPGRTLLAALKRHNELRQVLITPRTRGGRSKDELVYRLNFAAIAIDAPPSPSNRPLVSPNRAA